MMTEDLREGATLARPGFWRQLAGPAAVLLIIVLVGRLIGSRWPSWEEAIAGSGPAGYALFLGGFVLLAVLCFPVSVMGFSAGALFGPLRGLGLVFPGGLAAGVLMFLIARLLWRERIGVLVRSRARLAGLDRLARRRAFRLNLLTRLSPFNYGLASYALAVGSTPFKAYLTGLLATLPSMTVHVLLGHLAAGRPAGGSWWVASGPLRWLGLGLGLIFLALLTWTTGRLLLEAGRPDPADTPPDPGGGDAS